MMVEESLSRLEPNAVNASYRAIAGQRINLLMLPTDQQALLHWIQQQETVNLSQVAAYLGQDLGATHDLLQTLTEQGFLQEMDPAQSILAAEVPDSYRRPVLERESEVSPAHPLAIIFSPSANSTATAGSTFELIVTVFNRGDRSALVDVFIDETAQVIRQWCVSPFERLALGAGQSSEVVFRFQIPAQTLPTTYTYQVVIDSPDHYPEDTPLQYIKKLQVTPQLEPQTQVNDPTFTLVPVTRSTQPAVLQPGATLEVKVEVHNRSDRVDRFRLTCPDLNREWFTVRYPEGLETPGLITTTDGLRLNPNSRGEILLRLTPPLNAAAGSYAPTIRLHSANNPDLNLLDIVYLDVAPIYLLTAELQALIGKIRRLPGLYRVKLTNSGNIKRNLLLQVRNLDEDDDHLYAYTWVNGSSSVASAASTLPFTNSAQVRPSNLSPSLPIQVLPKQAVEVDLQVKPVQWWRRPFFGTGRVANFVVALDDRQQLPLPAEPLQATLIWKPRPWWQFVLLLLSIAGGVTAFSLLIWWLFFRPLAPAKVIEFAPEELTYQEEEGNPVRLKWQINHFNQVGNLVVQARQANGTIASQPSSYDFHQGIPKVLLPFCTTNQNVLSCRNVPTDARKAGNYVFELQVISRDGAFGKRGTVSETVRTDTILVNPIAKPQVVQYNAVVQSGAPVEGVSPASEQAALGFNSTIKPRALTLHSWKISNPAQIQELQIVGRDPVGVVNIRPLRFRFGQGLPNVFQPFCTLDKELICQNLPIPVAKAGDYIFELSVIPKQGQSEASAAKKTDTLKIEPIAPRILSFTINGQEALPKYIVPVDRNRPVRVITVGWTVSRGDGAKVELLPAPGSVPTQASMTYPLVQQPGSTSITLQVTNSAGKQVRRTIEIQVFDPNAGKPTPAPKIVFPPNLFPRSTAPSPPSGAPTANAPAPSSPSSDPVTPTSISPTFANPVSPTPVEAPPRFN